MKDLTFGEIVESEKNMILKGAETYGEYFINAFEFNSLIINFLKSINSPEKFIFLAFLSQVRKHHTLALFSAVRLHHTQTGMNLRQVFESATWAAYAMAFAEEEKFTKRDEKGNLEIPKKLSNKRNKWLDKNFKIKSDEIKKMKELINESTAHSNIIYSFQNFKFGDSENLNIELSFFDHADDYRVKSDLWLIANTALGILDLFNGVNQQFNVFQFTDDFLEKYKKLVEQNHKLKDEMTRSPRYLNAMKNIN